MDSEEDYYYSYNDDDDDNGSEIYNDDDLEPTKDLPPQNYTILSESDVKQLQEDEVTRLSNLLSISTNDSCTILRQYNWNSSKVHDEWFSDGVGSKVRETVGLLATPTNSGDASRGGEKDIVCPICFETYPTTSTGKRKGAMSSAACGHQYCRGCWRKYIRTSVNEGPCCLLLRCPDPSCNAAIGQDMIDLLARKKDRVRYARHLLRSYVEVNPKMKWCPFPNCDFVASFEVGSDNHGVQCKCGYVFCWNCSEEAHRPVDCGTIAKWMLKNSSEAENSKWILAYCKPCPQCHRQIEKNAGCMHMTCRPPCKYQFCWLCLQKWGGSHSCNRYKDETEEKRVNAKKSIDRYIHYYERWANNHSSRQKSLAELQLLRTEKIDILREKVKQPSMELQFLIEAWEQISECRRLLKWTYAYGYYMPAHERGKKMLFEYLQGEAEGVLEQLHKCAEKEVQVFFDQEAPSGIWHEFKDYRRKLAGLTNVTRNYFENLVCALEKGLEEVDQACKRRKTSIEKIGSTSSSDIQSVKSMFYWECMNCTSNNFQDATACEVCGRERN